MGWNIFLSPSGMQEICCLKMMYIYFSWVIPDHLQFIADLFQSSDEK